MHIILYEDSLVDNLSPITVGRSAFSIHIASLSLIELIAELGATIEPVVRSYLKPITYQHYPNLWSADQSSRRGPVLAVNARLVPDPNILPALKSLARKNEPCVLLAESGETAAIALGRSIKTPNEFTTQEFFHLIDLLEPINAVRNETLKLFHLPCDIVRHHLDIFGQSIEHRLACGDYREIQDNVFVPSDEEHRPKIGEYFLTDTSNGPIIIDSDTTIGPFCYIIGPVYIGKNSKVIEHAAIKDRVAIANTSKIGGEVEGSIIESYTNKQHHGFLGHSFLGSWVNLGAGTCNSDLKNSYNAVQLETPSGKFQSNMQFLGCMVGDYAKTAINTSIFTGKTIGAGSMNYGFITTAVPSFVNYARSFNQVTEISIETMIETQANMFKRRNVVQTPLDIQLLRDMFELTHQERKFANEPLTL